MRFSLFLSSFFICLCVVLRFVIFQLFWTYLELSGRPFFETGMYTSVYVRAYSCKVQADAEVEEDGEDKKPEEVTMEYRERVFLAMFG